MVEWILAIGMAAWLGILTSISPCPLATNIAAISFIGRRVDRPSHVLWTGVLYTLGRMMTYVLLGWVLVASLLSAPVLSHWLQKYMNQLLGPLLIVVGMVLLGLLSLSLPVSGSLAQWVQKRVGSGGLWGAWLLGVVFALSFCPVSAFLFFGSLVPLSIKHESGILLPLVYGLGTALPVFGFGVLVAVGANSLGRVFNHITRFELWARRLTGGLFLAIGIYYTLAYTLDVF